MQANIPISWPTRLVLLCGFACLCAAYLAWGWSDDITDLAGDSSGYALAAQYFSPFHPSTPMLADYVHHIEYPTLFPILIGLGGGTLLAAHLVVIAALLTAIGCLYFWLRLEQLPPLQSGCTALLFALAPGTYLQALNIWTENTCVLLSLAAIWMVGRAEKDGAKGPRFWRAAALFVAGATMTRVAAAPLLLAFGARLLLLRPRHWPWLLLAAAAPFTAWAAWGALHRSGIVGYTSHWALVYGTDGWRVLANQLGQEWLALVVAWTQLWLADTYTRALVWLAVAFGVLCLAGWLWRLRLLRFDALYVLSYGLLLLAWPHPEEARRYGYVLLPVLLGQGILLLQRLAGSLPEARRRLPAWSVLGALALLLLPALALTTGRFLEPLPQDLAVVRHTEYWYAADRNKADFDSRVFASILYDLRHVAGYVPEDDCIFSIKPLIVMLYAGRRSEAPPPESASDADFAVGIKRCRYAYPIAYASTTYKQSRYPLNRLSDAPRTLSAVRYGEGDNALVLAELVQLRERDRAAPSAGGND